MFKSAKAVWAVLAFASFANSTGVLAQVPSVVSTWPTWERCGSASTHVSATFDVDMDGTTINNSTFIVSGNLTGPHDGMIYYNSATRIATFQPYEGFDTREIVTVELTADILSSLGMPLEGGYIFEFPIYICGDVDGNGCFDTLDISYIVDWAFGGGPPPPCMGAADVNEDMWADISDYFYLVEYAYGDPPGPPPCGEDPPACPASQGGSLSLEYVDGLYGSSTDSIIADGISTITFYLRVTGDDSNYGGIANGFRVYSPDGAEWGSLAGDTMSHGWPTFFDLAFAINPYSADGMGADTVGFGGSKMFGDGLPAHFDEVSYTITIGPIDPSYDGKTIVLDSSFYPATGRWKWADPDVYPSWDGPHVFTIAGAVCGDVNDDGTVDIQDAVYLASYMFAEGPPPPFAAIADLDDFADLNVSDLVYLINYLFKGGPPPACGHKSRPFATPGGHIYLDCVDGLYKSTSCVRAGEPITFHIRVANDIPNKGTTIPGLTNGFRIYSPTGAEWGGVVADTSGHLGLSQFDGGFFVNEFSLTGSGADTVGFGGFALNHDGLPEGFTEIAYTITIGPIDPVYHGGEICLDSAWYPPVDEWLWATGSRQYLPDWNGPYCFTISALGDLDAQFSAVPTAGVAPLVVDFSDDSPGSPVAWHWDFGDGATSPDQNPQHQYGSAGRYDVSLRVTGSHGYADSLLRPGFILVGDTQYADLSGFAIIKPGGNRPGSDLWYRYYWNNLGTYRAENCTLKVLLPPAMVFDSLCDSSGAPTGSYSTSGDTMLIPLGTIEPSNDWCHVVAYGKLPGSAPPGDTLVTEMWLTSTTPDADEDDNYYRHFREITDSGGLKGRLAYYDNGLTVSRSKIADPNGTSDKYAIDAAQALTYTITFENLPEATANVNDLTIVDTLDVNLRKADQYRVIVSYPDACDCPEYDSEERTLTWSCLDLDLPPGEAAEVVYTVFPEEDLIDGTEISNWAVIECPLNEWLRAPEGGPVIRIIGSCCIPPIRGDIDYSQGEINVADLLYFVEYQFGVPTGPAPPCDEEADVDGSGVINIADLLYMVEYMFAQPPGPAPKECP